MAAQRSDRVSDEIARHFRNQIARGDLRPGNRLPAERELAERLNTSRVSVREAYRSLEHFGVIEVRRGAEGGAFISEVDHHAMRHTLSLMLHLGRTSHEELTEARLLIEPPLARLAARRASLDDVEALRALLEKQRSALRPGGNAWQPSLEFHRLIARCSRNLPLIMVANAVFDLLIEAMKPIEIKKAARKKTIDFHTTILEAIALRDETAAFEAMEGHVLEVQNRVGTSLAQRQTKRSARGSRNKG